MRMRKHGMKRNGRKLAHNTLEEMRVIALKRMNEGEYQNDVAASFGLHRSWAYKCKQQARGRGCGLKALRSTKGTGCLRKLTAAQETQAFRWGNGKRPDQYGFDFGLRTRQIVQELLLERFDVSLSLTSIGVLLARLGLSAQKPLQHAHQRDPEVLSKWKSDTYPAIAAAAHDSGAEILFWDESVFRADSVHGKAWVTKGQTPVVDRPGQRQSISAAWALSAKGAFWFVTYEGGLTGELFLPGYAPDLNPDELMCSHAKRTGVARNPLKKSEKLEDRVDLQLQEIADNPQPVRAFFKHPSVSYISDL